MPPFGRPFVTHTDRPVSGSTGAVTRSSAAHEVDDSLIVVATGEDVHEVASHEVVPPFAPTPARSPAPAQPDSVSPHPTAGRAATWGRRGDLSDGGPRRSTDHQVRDERRQVLHRTRISQSIIA